MVALPFSVLLFLHLLFLCGLDVSASLTISLSAQGNSSSGGISSSVPSKRTCTDQVVCRPGILLPVWLPQDPGMGEQAGRAVLYFSCLIYMFLGVSIVADRFMAAIEVITSQVQNFFFSIVFKWQSVFNTKTNEECFFFRQKMVLVCK